MGPSNGVMAIGDTKALLFANCFRVSVIVAIVLIALEGWGLEWIASCGLLGEMLALIFCVYRLRTKIGLPMLATYGPVLLSYLFIQIIFLVSFGTRESQLVSTIGPLFLVLAISVPIMLLSFKDLRETTLEVISSLKHKSR